MKNGIFVFSFLPLAALAEPAGEPAVGFEPVVPVPAWRISVGYRAAPGIRTSASVDARAAAAAAGGLLLPGRTGTSSSASFGPVRSSTTGTTEADALAAAGWSEGRTRWEFGDGYVDLDDGAGIDGETQNWHFDDASALADGAISARTPFSSRTLTQASWTRTETSRSVSLREDWGGGLRDSSDGTASGAELRLDRTLWEDADFGLDAGVGYVWYDDLDAYSVRGRAYSAAATTRTETRTETTELSAVSLESGAVVTTLSQPEFSDPDDIANADGSVGGGYVVGGTLPEGWKTPVLTVSEDRFSTAVERGPTGVGAWISRREGKKTSSKTTRRTVDVRSEGTLSLQELRLGLRPYWKADRWLALRGDVGLLATYSELETRTVLSVDGARARSIRKDDDDWTFGGYAGLAVDVGLTDALAFSLGAEARFPHRKLRFDDGVVSGSVELAEWSASASLVWRF